MTDRVSSSSEPGREGTSLRSEPRQKRPRTVYLLQRRYRMLSRVAALIGGAIGLALVVYSLGPPIVAGAQVPMASYIVAGAIIGALAIIPHVLVQWRWRMVKASLDDV